MRTSCLRGAPVALCLLLIALGCPQKAAKAPEEGSTPAEETKIEATFTPDDPVHRDSPEPPAESPTEKTDREFWTALAPPAETVSGLSKVPNGGSFLLKARWGVTPGEFEAGLPEAWTQVDYSNAYEEQLRPLGVSTNHYNFAFRFARENIPTSPPGAGGKQQKSPRCTAYFIDNTLAGLDINLIDSIATDETFLSDLRSMYGEPVMLQEQIDQPEAGLYLKMITLVWNFGPTPDAIESTQEFKVSYLGPAPGDKTTLLNEHDRIFGRMMRVFDPRLFKANQQLATTAAAAPPS